MKPKEILDNSQSLWNIFLYVEAFAVDHAFQLIWTEARPYYFKARPMDIVHIEWMKGIARTLCAKEKIDSTILIPLVILHDVGYSSTRKGNPFDLDVRKYHMDEGAKIASAILAHINYPSDKTKHIVHYVSIHDEWAFGNSAVFNNDIFLGTLNDLDFIWMLTPKGFEEIGRIRNYSVCEMLNFVETNEKLTNRPLCTDTTKRLFLSYLEERTIHNV